MCEELADFVLDLLKDQSDSVEENSNFTAALVTISQ